MVVIGGLLVLVSWACKLKADELEARVCGDPIALSKALQRAKPYNWPIGLSLLFLAACPSKTIYVIAYT